VKTVSFGHNLLGIFRQLPKNRDNAHDRTSVPATDGFVGESEFNRGARD
jgi:hypothetical protein